MASPPGAASNGTEDAAVRGSQLNVSALKGGLGGLAGLVALATVFFLWKKKKGSEEVPPGDEPSPLETLDVEREEEV
jgi:hypothetical protein